MPKPVIPTNAFAAFATLVCQRNCVFLCKGTKAQEFCKAEFLDSLPGFCGGILYWLLEKQGKLYFLQSSQTKGRGVLAAFATSVCQSNCVFLCKGTKLQNSAKPNSGDSLSVFALECVFAFDTGGLGLWLEGLSKEGLFGCQSGIRRLWLGAFGKSGLLCAKASLDPLCRAL